MGEMLSNRCGVQAGRKGALRSFFTAKQKASTTFIMVVHCVDCSLQLFILCCDTLFLLQVPKWRKQSSCFAFFCLTWLSNGFTYSFCSWQTSESRVNFVVLRQPGVQLLDPGEDGSTSNSSSSSGGGSPVHHRRRLDQSHYRRKSNYQKVSLEITAKALVTAGLIDPLCQLRDSYLLYKTNQQLLFFFSY